ncbi:PMVK [Lepeophtheirus salmonis]|uniref:Phosphomevalonate kinase n=1 Tax=Lepeophtheirus salmonis TaxID=72036 RepID=A0A7R8HEQ1_LEPSM|nr:PMVK [Lepeophtheirus salmonis]CAF3046578.1 PMVK [Lepeophtheirus salmonis]
MPKIIYLFMGKRKSGKDYITDLLESALKEKGENVRVVRLSSPIKKIYAERHDLDYEKLLSASDYKEKYRADMIEWSEELQDNDKLIWIVSDCRRQTDIDFFEYNFPDIVRVRIKASEKTRQSRGFVFQKGIDDAESECGLDDFDGVDVEINNDNTPDISQLVNRVK